MLLIVLVFSMLFIPFSCIMVQKAQERTALAETATIIQETEVITIIKPTKEETSSTESAAASTESAEESESPSEEPEHEVPTTTTEPEHEIETIAPAESSSDVPETTIAETTLPQMTYLGNYRITFYCPGACCCGKWAGGHCESGVYPTTNHTIACGPDIPFGTVIYVEGMGTYVCEDRGVPSGCIDIFVNTHAEIPSWGLAYFDCYIVNY